MSASSASVRGSSPTCVLSALGSARNAALYALISERISFCVAVCVEVRPSALERSITVASVSIRVARSESSFATAGVRGSFFFLREVTSALATPTARRCALLCFKRSSIVFFAVFLSALSALARERTRSRSLWASYCIHATSSREGFGSATGSSTACSVTASGERTIGSACSGAGLVTRTTYSCVLGALAIAVVARATALCGRESAEGMISKGCSSTSS